MKFISVLLLSLILLSCKKTDSVNKSAPTASFTSTKHASLPFTVAFTSTSTGANPIVAYQWNFGDPSSGINNTSALSSPIHLYNAEGNYSVRLITTDNLGAHDTVIATISAALKTSSPISTGTANFTYSIAPSFPYLVTFTNSSINSDSYKWFFGDGSEANNDSSIIHHYYFFAGTYTVSLVAYSGSLNDTSSATMVLP